MKWQLIRRIGVILVLFAVAALALLFGLDLLTFRTMNTDQVVPSAINAENAHQGTTDWQIPNGQSATTEIQAYANATSVSFGQALTFYVSTQKTGTPYEISIYRLGWYGGLGGRLMASQANQFGVAQGYYDESNRRLVNCSSCRLETQTGLVEANWQPSYSLTVPADWTTGVYLAKFTDANNKQTYVPFDVLGNPYSRYVAVTSDTTYAAYNDWGGYSLYSYNSIQTGTFRKAMKVSFNRPYVQGYGSGFVLSFEADAIRWLERQGYDLSYMSSVDLHEDPGQILHHHAYLSLGHDEYWSKEMRDGVEHARDHGVGLAFLGANAAYWQMRFEPDSAGSPNRTIVCYKVLTNDRDLNLDPLYGKDNSRVTTLWRDPLLNRPENALIGIMFSNQADKNGAFSWWLSSTAKSPLLGDTGLQPEQSYGCRIVGYEWDRVFANGATPPGLQVIGTSSTVDVSKKADVSNTTYYKAPSGAIVFATGSIYWTAALDDYRLYSDQLCAGKQSVVPGIQKLMANVMDALVINHT